jgi:hypothetical protein
MTDPKSTFAEAKCELVLSLIEQADKWRKIEEKQVVPNDKANASRIRRFLASVARFADTQG